MVFLTTVIGTWEGQHTVVLDRLVSFMQADMDKLVHVCFHGEMVNKLIEIDKEMYELPVVDEKGEQVMYIELLKSLY